MIFVSVGTISFPFRRLIKIINSNKFLENNRQYIYIQIGNTPYIHENNKRIKISKFISNQDFIELLKKASVFICSGGEGTILQAQMYLKTKPIIFPRLKDHNEHINNQQLEIGINLKKRGLAHLALDEKQLIQAIKKTQIKIKSNKKLHPNQKLIQKLSEITHLNQ